MPFNIREGMGNCVQGPVFTGEERGDPIAAIIHLPYLSISRRVCEIACKGRRCPRVKTEGPPSNDISSEPVCICASGGGRAARGLGWSSSMDWWRRWVSVDGGGLMSDNDNGILSAGRRRRVAPKRGSVVRGDMARIGGRGYLLTAKEG